MDLPDPGMEHASPSLAGGFLTTAALGKPHLYLCLYLYLYINVTYYVPGSVLASGNETEQNSKILAHELAFLWESWLEWIISKKKENYIKC